MSNEDKPTTVQDLSPHDQAKYSQIDNKVRDLHTEISQSYDRHGPDITAGLLERYKVAELKGDVTGVCLSEANKSGLVRDGENVIGFVGPKYNPTCETFYQKSDVLIATPAHESLSRVVELDRSQQIAQSQQQTLQRNRDQEEPAQGAPSMGTRSNIS